jgi:diguanylate cyclase (GGDEF)-like protein
MNRNLTPEQPFEIVRGALSTFPPPASDDVSVTTPSTLEQIIAAAPALRHERATLTLLTGLNAGQVFSIDGAAATLGRSVTSQIRLEDAGLSRDHARIVREGSIYRVIDTGSRNGTWVNGVRVAQCELFPGDRLHLGAAVVFRFAIVDETEERLARQLYEASTRDALSGLYNRRYFNERLISEVAFAHRHKSNVGLVLFDIDHFKMINDAHGHQAGDVVLRQVSDCVGKLIRTEDVLARYGGEEFVLLTRSLPQSHLLILGERIRAGIQALPVAHLGESASVTVSAGLASIEECGSHATGDMLLLLADERLYKAKSQGRNCVAFE